MLKIGDRVKVAAPPDNTANTIRKYNGHVFLVKRASRMYNGTYYYELMGVKSDKGVPYAFCEGWLQKVMP